MFQKQVTKPRSSIADYQSHIGQYVKFIMKLEKMEDYEEFVLKGV